MAIITLLTKLATLKDINSNIVNVMTTYSLRDFDFYRHVKSQFWRISDLGEPIFCNNHKTYESHLFLIY